VHIYLFIDLYIKYPHCITGLIIRFGFGSASGIHVKDAVAFLLPFYEEANDRTRESAHGIVREALTVDPQQTVDFLRAKKPELARKLAIRAVRL